MRFVSVAASAGPRCVAMLLGITAVEVPRLAGQQRLQEMDCALRPDRAAVALQPALAAADGGEWTISNQFGEEVTRGSVPGVTNGWRHTGIDLLLNGRPAESGGQPVHAVGDGVVVFSTASNPNPVPARGELLIVRHVAPDGRPFRIPAWTSGSSGYPQSEAGEFLSYYLHLSPAGLYEQGTQVTAGEVIGRTYTQSEKQRNGYAYVPHLHLEVWSECSVIERNGYDAPGTEFDRALGNPVVDPEGFLDANGRPGADWAELSPGGSAGEITFRADHTVLYGGRQIARGGADETLVLVSPPSPRQGYRIVLVVDADVGARQAYVVGGAGAPGVSGNLAPEGWRVQRWAAWSPDESHVLLLADGEVTNGDLLVASPRRGTARVLQFRRFARSDAEMQEIDPESIRWQTPAMFEGDLQILCNPYEAASCPERPLRTQRVQVNAATLSVRYGAP